MQRTIISDRGFRFFTCGVGCSAGTLGSMILSPTVASAVTIDGVTQRIVSSPWACFGTGAAAGVLVTAIIARGMHRRGMSKLEERIRALEEAQQGTNDAASTEDVAQVSPVVNEAIGEAEAATKSEAATQDVDAPREAVHPEAKDQVSVEDAARAASSPTPAPSAASAKTPSTSRSRRRFLGANIPEVDSPLGDALKVADENDLPHIERGQGSLNMMNAREDLERTHAMQVLRTLDGATRAKMINRRIPSLGSLNAAAEPGSVSKAAKVQPRPIAKDPESRVMQILDEEIGRTQQVSARDFSRSKLTIVNETPAHMKSASEEAPVKTSRPRGRHFAPEAKEA